MEITEYIYNWSWSGYNPISVGWQECSPNHSFGPGIREFYTVHFVLSGTGTYVVKGKEYHPTAGQIFCFAPFEPVYYTADEKDPWSYIWINFMINGTVPYRFHRSVEDAPFLRPIFEAIKNYSYHDTNGQGFTTDCLNKIAEQLATEHSNSSSLIGKAIRYIQNHYTNENLSITEIADKIGTNRYTLAEIFSIEKGITPIEYLVRFRLEKACEYMKQQGLSPSVAAYSVGYKNYTQFGRIFKKYYGVSPKAYQKQDLEENKS